MIEAGLLGTHRSIYISWRREQMSPAEAFITEGYDKVDDWSLVCLVVARHTAFTVGVSRRARSLCTLASEELEDGEFVVSVGKGEADVANTWVASSLGWVRPRRTDPITTSLVAVYLFYDRA